MLSIDITGTSVCVPTRGLTTEGGLYIVIMLSIDITGTSVCVPTHGLTTEGQEGYILLSRSLLTPQVQVSVSTHMA